MTAGGGSVEMASWFEKARFGMFIHWNHSSQSGLEISWPMVGGTANLPHCQDVPVERYYAKAASFSPAPGSPRRWLERARRAGMRYAVLTTKHHDGYSMYATRHSDFSVARSAYGGDLVREYVDAVREAGLAVGFYFSLCDWHHPDYPAFRDEHRPYRFGRQSKPTEEQWKRFHEFLVAQLRELLTDYGKIDVLWFDGGWERSARDWRSQELEAMIRSLQPGIVINDRLPGVGDYDTPEQFIPPTPPLRAWETCMTMNESWSWNPADRDYKSARSLVHALCEVAGRGGNLLLNVSPMGDGALPAEQVERLDAIAGWMDGHADAILDTTPGLEPWQFYGPSTRKGDRVFLHLLMRPYEDGVVVRGLPIKRIARVRELKSGRDLDFSTRCAILDQLFNADPMGEATIRVPEALVDPLATVVEVEITPAAS
jgi:alpha-L-fucosidase